MPALSKEALEKFARSYTGDDLPGALVDALTRAENIKARLVQLKTMEEGAYGEYELAHQAIEKDVNAVRRACKHLDVTTHQGDSSVGVDDSTICNVCGAEL